jgi:hypothetical protein
MLDVRMRITRSLRRRALRRGLVPFGEDVRLSDLSPDRFPRADGYVRANRSTRPCVFLQAEVVGPHDIVGLYGRLAIDGDMRGRNRTGAGGASRFREGELRRRAMNKPERRPSPIEADGLPDFIFERQKAVEEANGFTLAGKLLTDIPKHEVPSERDGH